MHRLTYVHGLHRLLSRCSGGKYFSDLWRETESVNVMSSSTGFVMQVMMIIFSLTAFQHTLSLPVTTVAKDSLQLFYCKPAGCAADVAIVFCDDKLLQRSPLPDCSGPPHILTVCQHDGRAYVATSAGIKCEFEEESKYIPTEKCTDDDPICLLIFAMSPSPNFSNNGKKAACVNPGAIALAAIYSLMGVII